MPDKREPLTMTKCGCGHPACNQYFLNITHSDGRVDKEDSEFMMLAWNNHDKLVEALTKLVGGLDYLIGGSYGVAGLHQNGETAPWGDLTRGGCCEEWLRVLDDARDTLAAVKGA